MRDGAPSLILAVVAAVASLGAGPGYDVPHVSLTGDISRVGHIDMVASASSSDVQIVEDVGATVVEVPSTRDGSHWRAAEDWSCERTTRTFRAVADGYSSAPYIAQTPPCDARLRLGIPDQVRRGATLRVKFRDLWRIGNISVLFCAQPPGEAGTCESVEIPEGQFLANRVLEARTPGVWNIGVFGSYQNVTKAVTVVRRSAPGSERPSILTTGDSLMLTPTTALERATGGRARVIEDVYPSAGLLKPFIVDWDTLPAKQVRAYHQRATVLTLGIGDDRPIITSSGEIECCGEDWIVAYASRARALMRTYAQRGRAAVVWLNVPYPRDVPAAFVTQINRALALAAGGLDTVEVVDAAAIFTPDRTFRQTMRWHGRRVKVRVNDGVHLSAAGARIAVKAIRRALARLGVPT